MAISPLLKNELAQVCKTYSFDDGAIAKAVNTILAAVIADRQKIDRVTVARRQVNLKSVLASYEDQHSSNKIAVLARKLEVIRTGRTLKTINDLFTSLVEDDNMEDFMEFVFELDQILMKYRRAPITDSDIDTLNVNLQETTDEETKLDDKKVGDTKEIKELMPGKRKVAKPEEDEPPIEYNSAQANVNGWYIAEGYRAHAAAQNSTKRRA